MPRINLVRGFDGRSDVTDAFPLKPIHFEHAHDMNMEPADSAADASSTMHSTRKIWIGNLKNSEVDQESEMDDNSRKSKSKSKSKSSKKDWKHKYSSRTLSPPTHGRQNRRSRSPVPQRRSLSPDRRCSRSPTPDRRRFRSPERRHDRHSHSRKYSDYRDSLCSRSLTYSKSYRDESRSRSEACDDLDIERRRSARYRSHSPQDSHVYRSGRRADYGRRDDYGHHDDYIRRDSFDRSDGYERLHSYERHDSHDREDHEHRHNSDRYEDYDRGDTRAEHGYNARENHVDDSGAYHDRSSLDNTGYNSRRSSAPRPHRPGYFHGAPMSPRHRHHNVTPYSNGRGIGYSAIARSAQSSGQWRRPDDRGWPVRGGAVRFRQGGGEGAFLGRHLVTRR